jgi:hypothetical protein
VERAVDLEHHDTAVAADPLTVQESATALLVETDTLPGGCREPCRRAQPGDVDLGERLGSTGDVAQREREVLLVSELAQLWDRVLETVRRRQPLLDAGREQSDGPAQAVVALRGQEGAMLERQPRWSHGRRGHPALVGTPGLVEGEARQRRDQVALGGEDVDDLVAAGPAQSGGPRTREVREPGVGAGVHDAEPEALRVVEGGVLKGDDAASRHVPAAVVDLVVDLPVGPAQCRQLSAGQHPRLPRRQRLEGGQPRRSVEIGLDVGGLDGA